MAGHFAIPEVCLYFDRRLFRGNRVTKVAANDFSAFDSPNYRPLAVTTAMQTDVAWELVRKQESNGPVVVQPVTLNTCRVTCLRVFPGIEPDMVHDMLKIRGLRGLVLETFGPGSVPGGLIDVLSEATKTGIVIVSVSQCLRGTMNPVYASVLRLSQADVVILNDMTTEAALAKLTYLLGFPNCTPESVARDMAVSLRGEMLDNISK